MQKTSPKILSTVSEAKIYLYHINKTIKAKTHRVEISLELWKSSKIKFFENPFISSSLK